MTKGLYTSPFRHFKLTPDEKRELHDTANRLVDENQQLYESQLGDTNASFASAQWDLIRECDGIRVYHDRRQGGGTDNHNLHLLLTVGSIPGTLHDAMYGELNHTTDGLRLKTAYLKEPFANCAVLDSIVEPTENEPFRSVTVRWHVREVPLYMRPLVKHRDNVFLEATGMRRLASGEDVGFHLMHSVPALNTPHLPAYGRSFFSICTVWRQLSLGRVHVFRTAYAEFPDSSLIVSRAIRGAAQLLILVQNVIDCAHRKKLASLIERKSQQQQRNATSLIVGGCSVCATRIRCPRERAKAACAACGVLTCKECHSKTPIFVVGSDNQMHELKFRVCRPCTQFITQLDGAEAARNELRLRRSSKQSDWLLQRAAIQSSTSSSDSGSPRY